MKFKDQQHYMLDSNSEFLPFGDNYVAMDRTGTKVTGIGYTKSSLTNVVASLSKPISKGEDKPSKDQAQALIFMVHMISETLRFVDIYKFYGSQIINGDHLPKWMFKGLEKNWKNNSRVA